MSKFSSSLQLTDLNDYITPSQACVRPVKIDKSDTSTISSIEVNENTGQYFQVNIDGSRKELKKTKIDLSDCLACSGCVTSAESVLVNQQSLSEFLRVITSSFLWQLKDYNDQDLNTTSTAIASVDEEPKTYKIFLVSISPQSIASIAAHFDCSVIETERRLHYMFHTMGASKVFDTTWARHFSHLEMCREFDTKFAAIAEQRKRVSATLTTNSTEDKNNRRSKRIKKDNNDSNNNNGIPMLTSSCPGFVCYAEKTFGDFIIPFISTTKSPQQIMGTLLKRFYLHILNNNGKEMFTAGDIYHMAVMPCFDKKLEASREDFQIEDNVKEVDIVLTSSEIINLLNTQFNVKTRAEFRNISPGIDSNQQHPSFYGLDAPFISFKPDELPSYGILESMESGGYTEVLFRYAAKKYFDTEIPPNEPLQFKTGRNSDFKEVVLHLNTKNGDNNNNDNVALRFAIAYGFRNIQNVIRKMKSGRCEYDFIEVMACPSGCVNGGGQATAPETTTPREHLQKVKHIYKDTLINLHSKYDEQMEVNKSLSLQEAYDLWFKGDGLNSEEAKKAFHTQYHARQQLQINPLTIQW